MLHILNKIDSLTLTQKEKLLSELTCKKINFKGKMILEYPLYCTEKKEYYPVSSAQFRVFIANQVYTFNSAFNNQLAFVLSGEFDIEKIREIFNKLITRHEVLRTSFFEIKGQIYQKVHEHAEVNFQVIQDNNKPLETIIKEFVKPFDLALAPLFRIGVCNIKNDEVFLILDIHHIISDAESLILFTNEFIELYKSYDLGKHLYQYRDYAQWENVIKKKVLFILQKKFWNEIYTPLIDVKLPFLNKPEQKDYSGDVFEFSIELEEKIEIEKMVKSLELTLFMFLLGAFALTISKLTYKNDIIIGSPVAGRRKNEFEKIMGIFVNMLSFRVKINNQNTIQEFYNIIKNDILNCFDNQEYPYDELVKDLNLKKALFDIVFVFQNAGGKLKNKNVEINDDLAISPFKFFNKTSKFALLLETWEEEKRLGLRFEYSTYLFDKSEIQKMSENYKQVIRTIISNKSIFLSEIETFKKANTFDKLANQSEIQDFDF